MAETIALTERDDGVRVRAAVGDTIEVDLAENATTGYRWALDGELDAGLFEMGEVDADYPASGTGTGGRTRFRITVRAPGRGQVRLKYWRHWEGERGVSKRYAVDVEVASP